MSIVEIVFVIAFLGSFFFLADTITVAIYRVLPAGKFRVLLDNPSSFRFSTDLGTFSADQTTRILSFSLRERHGAVPFAAIKGLEYRAEVKSTTLGQLFFGDQFSSWLGGWNRWPVSWFSIAAVTVGEERVPLYLGGKLALTESPFFSWYSISQAAVLDKLIGIVRDEEVESRAVLELLQRHLGEPKLV